MRETNTVGRVRLRLLVSIAVAALLGATLPLVIGHSPNAGAGVAPVQIGFVPMPADQFQAVMAAVNSAANTTLDFTVGITSAGAGAIITYDQWEDGYEADLANPTQATTQVWGDGNPANGDASTVCSLCAGDLIPQGAVIILRNNITTPRDSSQIRYDGRDQVGSTRGFALTAGGFSTPLGSVLGGSVSAFDTSKYGTDYLVPVGQNTPTPSGTSPAFAYTGAVIMAAQDGTTVQVDKNGDGTFDQSNTINKGEVVFVNGGLDEGAHIVSDKPVQVHLATGDVGASYESRWFTLFPTPILSSDYLSPVGSSNNNQRTIIYLYNPNSTSITVTPTCTSCSGTLSISSHASTSFATPLGEAVRFASSGGEPFLGIGASGAQSGAAPGSAGDGSASYDWGYTLIPTGLLTTQAVLGWAPGNSANPPASAGAGHDDDNPVWVTTLTATTVHVDYDGDPSTGAIASTDCFGGHHDADISVGALASTRIIDASDSDMTGARVYTCDGTKIAGAWGEDPANAPTGSPGFDAGYTLIPSTTMIVDKTDAIFNDANGDGTASPGDTLTYDVAIADAGSLAFTNVEVADAIPAGTSYVPGSTVFDDGTTTVPIADDASPPAATAFPLDEGGAALPDVAAGDTVHVRYKLSIDDPYQATANSITNSATVTAAEATASDTSVVPLTTADLSLTKSETASPVYIGDDATYHLTVSNAGPDAATGVVVTDHLPVGTTYVSNNPSQGTYDHTTGLWTVGTLANGASATIDITATVNVASVTNYAQVSASNAADPDSQPVENALDGSHPPDQDDEASATVNVVAPPDGSLGDTVWLDLNGDGVHDAGEPGIPNVDVSVLWAGPDNTFGTGDDVLKSDTTNSAGAWSVAGLLAGDYRVTVDNSTLPTGATTGTYDLDGLGTADQATLTLTTDQHRSDVDFAYRGDGSVGDTVFLDWNGNGTPDPGEGILGAAVHVTWAGFDGILGNADDVTFDAFTDVLGQWSVTDVPGGIVRVRVDSASLPAGLANTTDPDGGNDNQSQLSLASGATDFTQDFGYRGTATVGDTVFDDANGNNTPNAGEGLSAVGVSVTWGGLDGTLGTADDVVFHTTTNAGGIWSVAHLPAGSYRAVVDTSGVPNGLINTLDPDGGFDSVSHFTLTAGVSDLTQDFAYSAPGSVGDLVWLDANHDGIADPGETGMSGVTVTLLRDHDGDGIYETTIGTRVTDANGDYSFAGLPFGSYRVVVDKSTTPSGSTLTSAGHFDMALAPGETYHIANFGLSVGTHYDLSLTKALVGDFSSHANAVYEITVHNHGPSAAAAATVTDPLPVGLDYVSASGAGWVCSSDSGVVSCRHAGLLAPDASSTITVRTYVTAGPGVPIVNGATVSALGDTKVANNFGSTGAIEVVEPPSLPFTGSEIAALLALAAGSLALGTFLITRTRRRRAAQ